MICLVSHAFAEWTGSIRSDCGDSELNSTGLQLVFRIGEMTFGTFSDSSTEIIVISLFKSISSNSDRNTFFHNLLKNVPRPISSITTRCGSFRNFLYGDRGPISCWNRVRLPISISRVFLNFSHIRAASSLFPEPDGPAMATILFIFISSITSFFNSEFRSKSIWLIDNLFRIFWTFYGFWIMGSMFNRNGSNRGVKSCSTMVRET